MPTSGPLRGRAEALLRQGAESAFPIVRANAIEAACSGLAMRPDGARGNADPTLARELLQRGLVDANRGVRFVSAMNIAMVRLCDDALLVEPLLHDEHDSVRAAAIAALSRCGRPVDPTPLASMILSEDPEVRGNAAMALGEMRNPTALPVLQQSLGRGLALANPARVRIVELQVAEAQFRLGDASAAGPIQAALFAPPEQSEFAALACQVCGRIRDESSTTALERLVDAAGEDERAPEVRLAAITALAQLGRARAEHRAAAEALSASPRPDARAQAAMALGAIGDPAALPTLERLLSDLDPQVQVAAAGAVLGLSR